jgi:hypothetical protein
MAVNPPPYKIPLFDRLTGLVSQPWATWFRDMFARSGGTDATTVAEHIADATDAHDASAISNSASGNLAATNVQSALNELQTDVDTRATSASLTVHTGDVSNPHGVTAEQVLPDQTGNAGKFLKTDGSVSSWGTSAGGGGLNLLTLDSAYAANNSTDSDAETSVGRWLTYKNSVAGTSPDAAMTGGSPATVVVRSAVSPLNGAGSFVWDLGTGSSRQGEGAVLGPVYVPPALRGRVVACSGYFEATGALVEDDLKIYGYDITNSTLLTPFTPRKILGATGKWYALFSLPSTCATLRVGIHVARTSTAALSLKFDDVKLGDDTTAMGMAGSDVESWTPTGTWVSNTTYVGKKRLVGDVLEAFVEVQTTGAPTSATLEINLPTGITIDTAKLASAVSLSSPIDGWTQILDAGTKMYPSTGVLYSSATVIRPLYDNAGTNTSITQTAPMTFASGDRVYVYFKVPVVGRSSNVQLGESSVYKISTYLASGSRVTGSAPTSLGQYRSFLRNASARTYTETNGSPGTSPSASNGVLIYGGNAWGSADSNNEPSRYDIFVGKGKHVTWEFYSASGRTGTLSTDAAEWGGAGANSVGLLRSYDPTTGIASIVGVRLNGTNTTGDVGFDENGSVVHDGYFDIVVSENPLFVSSQVPRSVVRLSTGNGHGSTNTKIRRFTTTIENKGTAITYADSATAGASFTINEDGVYSMSYVDSRSTGGWNAGITKSSTQLTTSIASVTDADVLMMNEGGTNQKNEVSVTVPLATGDVIRPHTDGGVDQTTYTRFVITKVAN